MRAAGLTAIETILSSQAVLISNPHTTNQALIAKIANRIRGVHNAMRFAYCTYNAPRTAIKECSKITPGNKAPTITPLDEEDWVSMSSMVLKSESADIMDRLEEAGAKDILLFGMNNCRLQK